ncbi:MAG: FMN-binding protein, partial [Clostridiales bacterium]|nr:FMN-binding protein [Clostridiales bacterium]
MKKRIAAWITLGLITLGSGFLLSMTNEVTKGTIEKQEAESKVIARQAVLSSAERFEAVEMPDLNPLTELYAGKVGDEVIGYVGTAVTSGYGGPVQVIAGIDNDGTVSGISVGSSDFNETAGLGSKAKDASFMEQFIGKQTPIRAVKATKDRAENTVDAITAATITTNAVTGAVNQIANKIDAYLNPDDGELAEGTTYTADAQGYAGPVAVFVTVKDDGTISALNVGDERFAETQGFGAAATEPGFTKQFIGKSFPLTIEDIDAISGATKTSQAVIDALNKAFEDKVVVEPAGPEGITYTAAEKGFAGPVAVFVTVDENAAITALTIGDDKFAETEGYGAGATERVFTKQFIGKTLPITIED